MKRILFNLLLMCVSLMSDAQVSIGAHRILLPDFLSNYVASRNVEIWLPPGYSTDLRYPVLYMHDGQMLFDSTNTWNHQEWGVDEVMTQLINEKKIPACIVVGISNSGQHRRSDYAPWAAFETLTPNEKALVTYSAYTYDKDRISKVGANSDDYLKFIFKELKPFIDSSYSTLPDKAHTFMAGSSMGGIISLYALINYPDQLGGVACLSTHWPIVNIGNENPFPLSFINYINTHLPDLTSHRIYFDHGDQGRDAEYAIWQKQVDALFLKAGANEKQYLSRYFPGEGHNEKAWSKRLSIPLTFLLSE